MQNESIGRQCTRKTLHNYGLSYLPSALTQKFKYSLRSMNSLAQPFLSL